MRSVHFPTTIVSQSLILSRAPAEFNAIDKGSLYYLFISMKTFHAYMQALHNNVRLSFMENKINAPDILGSLSLPDGTADEPVNIFNIISGATGVAAAIPGNPAWQGATAVVSGVFGLAGELAPKE